MSTATLDTHVEQGIRLCPLLAIADKIDSSEERRFLVINNPCYAVSYIGTDSDKDGKRATYTRKPCDGYDTSCSAHPNHIEG